MRGQRARLNDGEVDENFWAQAAADQAAGRNVNDDESALDNIYVLPGNLKFPQTKKTVPYRSIHNSSMMNTTMARDLTTCMMVLRMASQLVEGDNQIWNQAIEIFLQRPKVNHVVFDRRWSITLRERSVSMFEN